MVLRTSLLVCLALVAIAFCGGAASPDKNVSSYSVEELVAILTDKLTSIDSLDCEYSFSFWVGGKSKSEKRCRSVRSGTKWHYEELSTEQQGRRQGYVQCYDDNTVYAYKITHQGNKVKMGLVELQDRHERSSLHPDDMLGVRLSNISRSIVDVLKMANITKSVKKLSDGTNGISLLAKAIPSASAGPKEMKYDVAITLDPAHDFLPREIVITESADNITYPGWEQRWKILDFRQVLDERINHQRWFPVSGILTQGSNTRAPTIKMKVDKVQINQTIPPTMFRPQIPDGTIVSDVTKDGEGKIAIKGGPIAISGRVKELTDQAHSIRDRKNRRWYILLAITAVVVPIFVLCWRWKLRRSKVSHP